MAPDDAAIEVGIIGMGDMGRLYAAKIKAAGWIVNACDRPEGYESLKKEYEDTGINVYRDGHLVSRRSDLIIYSVEAALIDNVVALYGPSTKIGSIVSGQTSVKAPEQRAFEAHLPADTFIISCHSLHGPKIDTAGQPLVLIQHRAPDEKMRLMERIMAAFKSRIVYLSYSEHDVVTANTQAVTHACFLAMGAAWRYSGDYPWETDRWTGPIETVKINIMIRILSAKWHVYAGLAILNPSARIQVTQYAKSTCDLFKMMVGGKHDEMVQRVFQSRRKVFGLQDEEEPSTSCAKSGSEINESTTANSAPPTSTTRRYRPILLSDAMLAQFHTIARKVATTDSVSSGARQQQPQAMPNTSATGSLPETVAVTRAPNSHLSLLAIVDCWYQMGIDPYAHLDLAATPIFRIWIGVCEYLFRSPKRLRASIRAGVEDPTFRGDDTEFVVATRGWAEAVNAENFEHYEWRFKDTARFFQPRFEEANRVGTEMLKIVMSS